MAENVAFNIFFGRGLRASGVEAARRGADSMRSHSLSWKVLREESRLTGGRTLQAGPAPPLWEAGQYAAPTLVNTTVGTKEIYRAAENNATVCPGQSTQTQTGAEFRCFSIIIICTRSLYLPIFRPLKKLLSRHPSVSAPSRQGHGLQRGQRAKEKKKKFMYFFSIAKEHHSHRLLVQGARRGGRYGLRGREALGRCFHGQSHPRSATTVVVHSTEIYF